MKTLVTIATIGAALALSLSAFADALPPNIDGCNGKRAGDACTDDSGRQATCVSNTCTGGVNRLPDGNIGTPSMFPCLQCQGPVPEGGADAGSSGAGTGDGKETPSCNAGAADLGSGVVLLAVLVPFVVLRKKKKPTR